MKKYFIISFCALLFIGCSDSSEYIRLNLPQKNPTSYTFNSSVAEIKKVLNKGIFAKSSIHGKENPLLQARYIKKGESNLGLPDSLKYLIKEEYYHIGRYRNDFPISRLYFSVKKEPLLYYGEYIIRFHPVSEKETRIEIITFRNELLMGLTGFFKFMSLINSHVPVIVKTVESTTIEEYEILVKIGEGLGVKKSMPKIIYPDYSGIDKRKKDDSLIYYFGE